MDAESLVVRREAAFWDRYADRCSASYVVRVDLLPLVHRRKLACLGELVGRRVLDIGCGTGDWSVILALCGADVWAMDVSYGCVAATLRLAAANGVAHRVHVAQMSGYQLAYADGCFDLIHGQDVLHHVHARMASELRRVLRGGGRAVFLENSANNLLLMAARRLCGHFGIPRWSSDDEYPLRRCDIEQYAAVFGAQAQVSYPVFLFFGLLDMKLFQYRSRLVSWGCSALDAFVYYVAPALRCYSYRQIVQFEAV